MSQDKKDSPITRSAPTFQSLPDDTLINIFLYLDGFDLGEIRNSCVRFNSIVSVDLILIERKLYDNFVNMILFRVFCGKNIYVFTANKDVVMLALNDANQISSIILNNLEIFEPIFGDMKKAHGDNWNIDTKERKVTFPVNEIIVRKELVQAFMELGLPTRTIDPFVFYFRSVIYTSGLIVCFSNQLEIHTIYVSFLRNNKKARLMRRRYIANMLERDGKVILRDNTEILFPTGNPDFDAVIIELSLENNINNFVEHMRPSDIQRAI